MSRHLHPAEVRPSRALPEDITESEILEFARAGVQAHRSVYARVFSLHPRVCARVDQSLSLDASQAIEIIGCVDGWLVDRLCARFCFDGFRL